MNTFGLRLTRVGVAMRTVKAAKALARDYQLPVSEVREVNLNNFMAHIVSPLPFFFCLGSFESLWALWSCY